MRSKRLKRSNNDANTSPNDVNKSSNEDDHPLITFSDASSSSLSPASRLRRKTNKNGRSANNSQDKSNSVQLTTSNETSHHKQPSKNVESKDESVNAFKRPLRSKANSGSSSSVVKSSSSSLSAIDYESSALSSKQITYSSRSKQVDILALTTSTSHSSSSTSENSSNVNKVDASKSDAINSTAKKATNITYIMTSPKSLTMTSVPKKTYGLPKFINDLPELSDCTGDPEDKKPQGNFTLLPDRICLLHADLPLKYLPKCDAPSQNKPYAYRQILSPHNSTYPCLLCPNKGNLTLNELKNHYNSIHELHTEVTNVKFPEDVIYACLPKETFDAKDENIVVNCPCQYCENTTLETLTSMVEHYSTYHNNKVAFVEQESVLKMHSFIYCYACNDVKFDSFKQLNQHMKSEHKMQTYQCRECSFFTREDRRLQSHFKAKHMLNSTNQQAMQCLECAFCNGLLMGKERMNKHIQSTHCIETSTGEYSCLLCHQVAGTCDTIIHHMSKCPSLQRGHQVNAKLTSSESSSTTSSCSSSSLDLPPSHTEAIDAMVKDTQVKATSDHLGKNEQQFSQILPESLENTQDTQCFICSRSFDTVNSCRLHMSHIHTKWIKRKAEFESVKLLVSHLPSMDKLQAAGVTASNGFYCHFCEVVIQVYPLFYLHMSNLHKMRKVYQCKINSCHEMFYNSTELKEHSETNGHPQKSVIEDTLAAICCHFCDMYFKDRKEYELHHLTDQHNIRVPSCKSFTSGRQEARNFKCKMCHTWFGLTDSFIYHMENETHKHSCPYCGIDFALPSSRRTHIQSHHTDKADVCEICSVKQGSKERLFPHLVTHGIMFECNSCIKVFYQKEQLNSHLETHAPLVDCHWSGCGRKIAPASLSLHIKQHRVQANSKCKTCGKVFSSPYLLESHIDVHLRAEEKAMQIMQVSKQNNEPVKNGSNSAVKKVNCPLCSETVNSQADLPFHKCKGKITTSTTATTTATAAATATKINHPSIQAGGGKKSALQSLPPQSSSQPVDISLMDTYFIQNVDGSIVELRVPAGMDLNEALSSIAVAANATDAAGVSTDAIALQQAKSLDEVTSGSNSLSGPLIIETNASNSGDQLIYITSENTSQTSDPSQEIVMNCDAVDIETLALLTSAAPNASSSSSVAANCF